MFASPAGPSGWSRPSRPAGSGLAGPAGRAGAAGLLQPEPPAPGGPSLAGLLPDGGLRRGTTLVVTGVSGGDPEGAGSISLALALLAAASGEGSWCALVGITGLGAVCAHDLGIDLDRAAVVPRPGPTWAEVTATLVEGVDLVLLCPPFPPRPAMARRLTAKVRERRAVLLVAPGRAGWPEHPDVALQVAEACWDGVGAGEGYLRGRQMRVTATGRRIGGTSADLPTCGSPRRPARWKSAARCKPVIEMERLLVVCCPDAGRGGRGRRGTPVFRRGGRRGGDVLPVGHHGETGDLLPPGPGTRPLLRWRACGWSARSPLRRRRSHPSRWGWPMGCSARSSPPATTRIVPPEGTPRFLAPFAVEVLGDPDLAELLVRLGIRTLGDFAALPEPHVLGRFGSDGVLCHRVARGQTGELAGLRRSTPGMGPGRRRARDGHRARLLRRDGRCRGTCDPLAHRGARAPRCRGCGPRASPGRTGTRRSRHASSPGTRTRIATAPTPPPRGPGGSLRPLRRSSTPPLSAPSSPTRDGAPVAVSARGLLERDPRTPFGGGRPLLDGHRVGRPVALGGAVVVADTAAERAPPGGHRYGRLPAARRTEPLVGRSDLRMSSRRCPTPSSTHTPTSPSSTVRAIPRNWPRRRCVSVCPRSP